MTELRRKVLGVLDRHAERRRAGNAPPPHWGTAMWAELHSYCLAPDDDVAAWLAAFAARVPACCQPHWLAITAASPPPDDPAGLFAWGVDRHNEVNAKLGKPLFPIDAARERWATPTP